MGKTPEYIPPTSPWPRPDAILIVRPGRLPRQSYPPQTGVIKLPLNDPLTQYLGWLAADEMWDEWDYCWSRLKYLPRWNCQGMFDCPPGWMTPHAFLAWATWHMTCAFQWLWRLEREISRSHSPEDLLSNPRPVNPIYQFLNKNQIHKAKVDVYKCLHTLRAGSGAYLPSPERVIYRPDGLKEVRGYILADNHLSDSIWEDNWHESRARHKAETAASYLTSTLRNSAQILARHLGESGWSE